MPCITPVMYHINTSYLLHTSCHVSRQLPLLHTYHVIYHTSYQRIIPAPHIISCITPIIHHINTSYLPHTYHVKYQTNQLHIISTHHTRSTHHVMYHTNYTSYQRIIPALHIQDSKVPGANTGPTWVLSAPDGLHDDAMNLAIRDAMMMMMMMMMMMVTGTTLSWW